MTLFPASDSPSSAEDGNPTTITSVFTVDLSSVKDAAQSTKSMIDTSSTEAMPVGEDGTKESGMSTPGRLSEFQAYFKDECGAWIVSQHNLLQVAL